MKKQKNSSKRKLVPFQSDIVIEENGDISISFLGADLVHLIGRESKQFPTSFSNKLNFHDSECDISKEYQQCMMCPNFCGYNRSNLTHPRCGDDKLRISNCGISFGDEDCISKDGGSGVMFLSGCPLTCPSCINPEKVREQGTEISVKDFVELSFELAEKGVNNLQVLSPTVHLPYLRKAFEVLKINNFPIPILFKSSGYEVDKEIAKLDGLVDVYCPDYKINNCSKMEKISNVKGYHDHFLLSLSEMYRQVGPAEYNSEGIIQKGVIVRHVKNPHLDDTEQNAILHFLNSLDKNIAVSITDNFIELG